MSTSRVITCTECSERTEMSEWFPTMDALIVWVVEATS